MDRMDDAKRELLLKYKFKALEIQNDKKFFSEKELTIALVKALPNTNSLILAEELKTTLRTTPLFLAIATWCDPDNGLGRLFPDQVLQVAEYFLPLEK